MQLIGSIPLHDEVKRLVPLVVLEGGKITEAFALRHKLHPTDADALGRLMAADAEGKAITIGTLGEHLGITSGATTFAVNRLERAGLVRRNRDPDDHRRTLLALSDQGRSLAERFYLPILERSTTVLSRFTDAELQIVCSFLEGTVAAMAACRASFEAS